MAPATNGECKPMPTRPANCLGKVIDIGATNKRCGAYVDLSVPQLTCLVISCLPGENSVAGEEWREIVGGRSSEGAGKNIHCDLQANNVTVCVALRSRSAS